MMRNTFWRKLVEKKWFIGAALFIGVVGALFVFYTSSSAAQFTISTTTNNSINGVDGTNPATVFISDQVGYAFVRNNSGTCSYTKTTNGGTSWGSFVQVSGGCQHIAIWYDRWTPGDTGTYVHIVISSTGSSGTLYYNGLDTSTDTLTNSTTGVPIETTVTNTMALTGNFPAISKSTTGVLYAGVNDAGTAGDTGWVFKCSSSCNTTGGWSDTSIALINTSDRDAISLAPLPGGDMIAVVRDFNASDILSKVYDEGTTTWDGSWATVDAAAAVRSDLTANSLATVVNTNTNDLYIVYTADNNSLGTNDDIRTAHYSSGTWTLKTDIVTNTAKGVLGAAIGIDLNTDDIYVGYMLRTTPATVATANVYWQKSTDGMTTWGGEQGPLNTAESSFFNVRINGVSDERMMVSWNEPGTTSLFGYMVADMTPNPEFEQESYRWFANENSTATSTVPTIVNSTMGKYNVSSGTTISMPAGIQDGDQLIMFVSTYSPDAVYTPGGTGWTNFFPATTAGTQVDVGWAKTYTTGMTVTLSAVTSRMTIVSLTAIRGAKDPSQWIAGSIWNRATHGTSTTTVAPGVTTTETNNLVLSFFGERTLADETDIVSITNATKHLYGYDEAIVQDETIVIGQVAQESIGTTSNVTVTYANSQASNGQGQQVAIPPVTVAAEADIGSSLAAQDTAYTSMPTGTPFRLRLNLGLVSGSLSASSYNLKLQYKLQTSGVCTTSGSYADVTTTTPVKFHNNTNITDGIDYVTSPDDPDRAGQTTIKQHYVESNPFTNVEATILNDDNIWDIALVADTATIGEKYCFKAMKSDGTLFTTYTHIPEITFIAPTPSLTQQLRGGQSVIDGVKIPFSL